MRSVFSFAALALIAVPACGGETSWQEIAPDVQMRVISSGTIKPDGTTLVGLEIQMPPNTKTYWRIPGDTGFPAEFDFSGSKGVQAHAVHWPFPARDQTAEYLDYVYRGPTVLPIELTLSGGVPHLELATVLGICSDVCVPAQASFSLPLADPQPDRTNALRIKQAMALAPLPLPADEAGFGEVSYDATGRELRISVAPSDVDLSSLIVTAPGGMPHFGTPQKSPEPNLVVVPVLAGAEKVDWDAQAVQLTFMTDEGSFEVTRTVQAAAAR
jgi:DsbC/DsbD-like thiol-disulfide interchange protein